MALSWKYDAWKELTEDMKHINKYTMFLAICRIKIKNLDSFDNSIYRPFSEYISFFEETILKTKKTSNNFSL